MAMSSTVLQEIQETRQFLDGCYFQDLLRLQTARSAFDRHMCRLETLLVDATPDDAALLATPNRPVEDAGGRLLSPSMASPPVSRATPHYAHRLDDVLGPSLRPTPESVGRRRSPPERGGPCRVLVVFKRNRMLQFESAVYVAPGEYVAVGGDRGEDVGLVTHAWAPGDAGGDAHKWAEGVGRVLRVASALEVSLLQGVQTELEVRAVEVAQKKVEEHGLSMNIVDAEYQFDRKKLTFYYRSQSRLDFRNLVRDLYKTFRARIWMEPDVQA